MAVSVFKTFSAGEILTASDLNSSLTQITGNGEDLGWPATKLKDLDGFELVLDGDGDSSWTADSDDIIHGRLQGVDLAIFNGATASAVNGMQWTFAAAGSNVALLTQGSDTNIHLDVQPKGSGQLLADGDSVMTFITMEMFS